MVADLQTIMSILQAHGRDNPISMPELARQLGVHTREIQSKVRELRDNGEPIGSRCDPPFNGYYLASPAEALETAEQYMNRAVQIFRTGWRMKQKASGKKPTEPQLALFAREGIC